MTSLPRLDDSYARVVPDLSTPWSAAPLEQPRLLALDDGLARELGLDPDWLRTPEGVAFLTGAAVPEGHRTYAQAYAGHQFGGYSPVLGDGRALLLGEIVAPDGRRFDLHLKGSGRTPYARGGDGLAAVGPMLREFLMGVAMHALGIPTTRALAVIATGRTVMRERPLPGAVLVRVASSHLRVGTFQYAASLGRHDVLQALADHAIDRHHPAARDAENPYLALFAEVARAQARLVAAWMSVGFVHGVMNTDNVTISGQTIDYGPCAFIDAHDPAAVYSSIDHQGRYSYGNQPGITQWNLARLAEAMIPLFVGHPMTADHVDTPEANAAVAAATGVLADYATEYEAELDRLTAAKLGVGSGVGVDADMGLGMAAGSGAVYAGASAGAGTGDAAGRDGAANGDESVRAVYADLTTLLTRDRVDHTTFFRALGDGTARALFTDVEAFDAWLRRRDAMTTPTAVATMAQVNPVVIPRNHVVEEALTAATDGDLTLFEDIVARLRRPFDTDDHALAHPAPPDAAPHVTFCGT